MLKIGHYFPCYRKPEPHLLVQVSNEARTLEQLGHEYYCDQDEHGDIVIARNRALENAIKAGLDFLCMQDSDNWTTSSVGAIAPMLQTAQANGAAAVAAIVGLRGHKRCNVEPARPREVYRGKRAGAGILLIDIARVKDYPRPFFMNEYSPDGLHKDPGQDIYFSRLLESQGGELWIDGRIPTIHKQSDLSSLFYPGTDATAGGKSQAERTALAG